MSPPEFKCAQVEAARGRERCQVQCEFCKQQYLTTEDGRVMTTVETYGGNFFDYDDPRPEQITLMDVAHHLSQICRYGGACNRPYSVARHALDVRRRVIEKGHPELGLAALHHDSHEYMLGDWPTPLKRKLRSAGVTLLDEMVEATNLAIADRFGIDVTLFDHTLVKEADTEALYSEAAVLKHSRGVGVQWGRTEPAEPIEYVAQAPTIARAQFILAHKADGGLE